MRKYETIDENCWVETTCVTCKGSGNIRVNSDHISKKCPVCDGYGTYSYFNNQRKVKPQDEHYVCILEFFNKSIIPNDILLKSSFVYDIKSKRILKQRKPSEKNVLLDNLKQITIEGKF